MHYSTNSQTTSKKIHVWQEGRSIKSQSDSISIEEPLEIRQLAADQSSSGIAITMRTPGQDIDLTIGFLYSEGIIRSKRDVKAISHCGPTGNIVKVDLVRSSDKLASQLKRNFYTTSSCGVCGKSSIEALEFNAPYDIKNSISGKPSCHASVSTLLQLPDLLRKVQRSFDSTGGIHAAGLFNVSGKLIAAREDVGRHNALDKLIGAQIQLNRLPLEQAILLLSGRASFELIQKAIMAGLPIVCAIGAPSSLAIELAQQFGQTLIGFLKNDRFNIYSHPQRIQSQKDFFKNDIGASLEN